MWQDCLWKISAAKPYEDSQDINMCSIQRKKKSPSPMSSSPSASYSSPPLTSAPRFPYTPSPLATRPRAESIELHYKNKWNLASFAHLFLLSLFVVIHSHINIANIGHAETLFIFHFLSSSVGASDQPKGQEKGYKYYLQVDSARKSKTYTWSPHVKSWAC